jgi:peroxiredoxin
MTKNVLLTMVVFFLIQINGNAMLGDGKKAANSANDICPIKVGERIPDSFVQTLEGEKVNLYDYVSGKQTVLIFYRGGWCPYCNLQLASLNNIEKDLLNLGYQLVAVSIDRPEKLNESIDKHALTYTLLSDSKAEASTAFGLAFRVDDKYNEMLKSHNMSLEDASGETHHILPVPAVFVLDKDGVIQFEYVNPDYKVRLNGELLLKAAEQFTINK